MPRPRAEGLRGDAGGQRDVVGAVAGRHPQGALDDVRLQPAVGVGEQDPVARGGGGAEVAGVALAEPALRQHVHVQDSHCALVLRRQAAEDVAGPIGRAVIDGNDLDPHAALPQQVADRRLDVRLLVVRRHDDRAEDEPLVSVVDPGRRVERRQRRQPPGPPRRGTSVAAVMARNRAAVPPCRSVSHIAGSYPIVAAGPPGDRGGAPRNDRWPGGRRSPSASHGPGAARRTGPATASRHAGRRAGPAPGPPTGSGRAA